MTSTSMYMVSQKFGDDLQLIQLFDTLGEAMDFVGMSCQEIETDIREVDVTISEKWERETVKEQECECGLDDQGKWSDTVFDRFGCDCEVIDA